MSEQLVIQLESYIDKIKEELNNRNIFNEDFMMDNVKDEFEFWKNICYVRDYFEAKGLEVIIGQSSCKKGVCLLVYRADKL